MRNYKKNIYHITGLLLIMLLLLLGCEKMVEIDDPTDQISTPSVFEDTHTADAALANLMAEIRDNSMFSGGSRGMSALLSSYTDDLDGYFINNNNAAMDIYHNQQLAGNTSIESLWRNAYKEIYIANSIMEGVEGSTSIPVKDRQRIAGEAMLLRSLIYFNLYRIFGDIPYTVTTDFSINRNLKRIPENELLAHLENDLQKSSGMLSDEYSVAERLYPSRKVAQLVLAELYLTEHKWQQAELMVKEVIGSPLYVFETDITKVFLKSGKHILWQLKPQNTGDATAEALLYYFNNAAPPSYAMSNNLVSAFSASDLRKQNWMVPVTFNQQTWYSPYKYKSLSPNTTEHSIVFRLEQAYCILAEALAEQGRVGEAVPYINAIRQRAGLTALGQNIPKDAFLNELLQEKRREFFTESGQRFFDLKRFNRLQDLAVIKPNWKSYHKVWPIPLSELLLNPNLNPQNEGY
ncbi:RagB/SusD family nutrient uptake outer membrane protein [Chryseobacterium paludis]|uniref:RagB/SusD family nutrient uptake outer membrane protein n=1 Tax=Chryseobacterium paludis TaxID=2956784 RepID=UPI0021C0543E|nr:RagB/SusD family nutrient uptake outer membrane protein [Chryseobacterium paludis]